MRPVRHRLPTAPCHDPVHDGDFFFDNETPRHRVWLDAFESASRPINQGGFLDFMNDGG
jgi:formylglycine-generating enzyme required for sulfatase activity